MTQLFSDIPYIVQDFLSDVRLFCTDTVDNVQNWWAWNEDLEKVLIKVGIRKEFDLDRCCWLIGVLDDCDYVNSSNYYLPWKNDIQVFHECIAEDVDFYGSTPTTTIQVANAWFEHKEHEAWIARAMDPQCWDY